MAWHHVARIKNALGEYRFAPFPVDAYNGPAGATNTQYSVGGYRNSNSLEGTSDSFWEADSYQTNILSLDDLDMIGKFSLEEDDYDYNDYDHFVFGKAGGTGARLWVDVNNDATRSYNAKPFKYNSFTSSVQLLTLSSSFAANDTKQQRAFCYFGMIVNEETEEMYLVFIQCAFKWENAVGTPGYYDRCQCWFYVLDQGGKNGVKNLWDIFHDSYPGDEVDPYDPGGLSEGTDTGTGSFDGTSDGVSAPSGVGLNPALTGIVSQYVLDEHEMDQLASWLWDGGSVVDSLKRLFSNPIEAIMSVGILPYTPSDTESYNVAIGKIDPGVTGKLITKPMEQLDFGTVDITPYYGGALDFNPYTKIELVLPYCGVISLNPDEFMGHTLHLTYMVDSMSGDCVAFVSDENRVLQQVPGNLFLQIPLSARDFSSRTASTLAALATIAGGAAMAYATGGMTAPIAVGMGTSVAANAMNAKTHIQHVGTTGGAASYMSVQTPYLIITIPRQCLPEKQGAHQGYPLFVTQKLDDCTGFTKVYEIHLDGLSCTAAEADEIYNMLKGGVII